MSAEPANVLACFGVAFPFLKTSEATLPTLLLVFSFFAIIYPNKLKGVFYGIIDRPHLHSLLVLVIPSDTHICSVYISLVPHSRHGV